LSLVVGLEYYVVVVEVDKIAGLASGMFVDSIVEFDSRARRPGCR
jgi:hypothetical protein